MHQNCFGIAEVENCDRVQQFDDPPSGHNLSKQLAKPTLDSFAILDVSYFPLAFQGGSVFCRSYYLKVPDLGRRFSLPIGIQKIK